VKRRDVGLAGPVAKRHEDVAAAWRRVRLGLRRADGAHAEDSRDEHEEENRAGTHGPEARTVNN
jgi:hypothetical protein